MNPINLKYTEDHEWIGREGDLCVVGITQFAQKQLGEITYVELPEIGRTVDQGEETAVVESVKAASDIYSPVMGRVAEVNDLLETNPELVNKDPYGEGWFFKLSGVDFEELESLMDAAEYRYFLSKSGAADE